MDHGPAVWFQAVIEVKSHLSGRTDESQEQGQFLERRSWMYDKYKH